jgi:hypothetical protein
MWSLWTSPEDALLECRRDTASMCAKDAMPVSSHEPETPIDNFRSNKAIFSRRCLADGCLLGYSIHGELSRKALAAKAS